MITIKIEGLQAVQDRLGNLPKQARFAAAVALTRTAQQVEKRLRDDMAGAFDNPSPWIAKGTFVQRADKATLTATVGVKDRQAVYVKEHFNAGLRGQKPYERALSGRGVLPAGYRAVPGAGLKLDARGIPNRAQLSEIFGALSAGVQVYKGRGKKMQTVGYFVVPVGKPNRLHPGIWWRSARQIKPMLIFVAAAGYDKILDLPKSAGEVVNREFAALFNAAFIEAMSTAQ